ncbi:hypothetical protein D3Z52_04055 [Clostridiaceae bacterium]|nr:hypothetical protein [Clostridiaceae bacterium]
MGFQSFCVDFSCVPRVTPKGAALWTPGPARAAPEGPVPLDSHSSPAGGTGVIHGVSAAMLFLFYRKIRFFQGLLMKKSIKVVRKLGKCQQARSDGGFSSRFIS